ncbi:ROK family protein [Oscillochloris sp. ZM17-4]|uniref:ROK family protein n=1 Tax=Oscillochloris sp. ZM17-4 TaxID=2866714 RepID=UPI001C72A6BA|nr:ROK family protein [Oscillochloris sp. ZM17-4]MBX0330739.1 ROK family protein [Oscillochloris sp. ZM17-4]
MRRAPLKLPAGVVIALDVGGTSVKSGLVDASPAVVGPVRQTPVDSGASAEELLALFHRVVAGHVAELEGRALRGVGAAFPNPFDYGRGVSLMRHKYAALYGADVGAAMRAALPDPAPPIAFRNDAEAAVVGEARFGAGTPFRRVIGVTLGTGLGACFVADGRAVRAGPEATVGGELWDQPFQGAQADDWFSIRGLQARLGADDIRAAAGRAAGGDAAMRAGFASFGDDLGRFLAPYVAQFRAEALLVLGGLAGAGAHFLPALGAALPVPALPGERGAHAALLGAAADL